MSLKRFRTKNRKLQRFFRRNVTILRISGILLLIAVVAYAGSMNSSQRSVNPTTYQPLLQLIGRAESNSNYNAYFGNADNSTTTFTDMTISEVLAWQESFIQQGNASSAVGKYQIINTTLESLVQQLDISPAEKFTPSMQDTLAIALLERRGARDYVNDSLTREQFAANLAKEWAGLPKTIGPDPEQSYYASDGLNASRVRVGELLGAIQPISAL